MLDCVYGWNISIQIPKDHRKGPWRRPLTFDPKIYEFTMTIYEPNMFFHLSFCTFFFIKAYIWRIALV